ncbi:MAG TPA: hypothetical protein VL574_16700, partial [Stellaceae bacterium]|nr:hypothetical protein [Stellaceae bacterium]
QKVIGRNELLQRHDLKGRLVRRGLPKHKAIESKAPAQGEGFVSNLSPGEMAGAFFEAILRRSEKDQRR